MLYEFRPKVVVTAAPLDTTLAVGKVTVLPPLMSKLFPFTLKLGVALMVKFG